MKWPWSKPKITPPVKPAPKILTEEELDEIKRLNEKAEGLRKELRSWPDEQDFVKIKITGQVGQVTHRFWETCGSDNGFTRTWPYRPDDELYTARIDLEMMEDSYARNTERARYEVRLKNGSVVGNLRWWEIEKTKSPTIAKRVS